MTVGELVEKLERLDRPEVPVYFYRIEDMEEVEIEHVELCGVDVQIWVKEEERHRTVTRAGVVLR